MLTVTSYKFLTGDLANHKLAIQFYPKRNYVLSPLTFNGALSRSKGTMYQLFQSKINECWDCKAATKRLNVDIHILWVKLIGSHIPTLLKEKKNKVSKLKIRYDGHRWQARKIDCIVCCERCPKNVNSWAQRVPWISRVGYFQKKSIRGCEFIVVNFWLQIENLSVIGIVPKSENEACLFAYVLLKWSQSIYNKNV